MSRFSIYCSIHNGCSSHAGDARPPPPRAPGAHRQGPLPTGRARSPQAAPAAPRGEKAGGHPTALPAPPHAAQPSPPGAQPPRTPAPLGPAPSGDPPGGSGAAFPPRFKPAAQLAERKGRRAQPAQRRKGSRDSGGGAALRETRSAPGLAPPSAGGQRPPPLAGTGPRRRGEGPS
ncbi:basic proline-rich protein-like [Gavia stellata]|uniref:basic proline-rich protein-like n=1 Tax=Gavia stellata TaxID=37040 RepID=UPI00289F6E0A|nr:basic proline-rich protein-like [Gavia stellata]